MVVSSLQESKKLADSWHSDLHLHCRSSHLSSAPVPKDVLTAVVSMPILTMLFPCMGQRWDECLPYSHWLTAGPAQQSDDSVPETVSVVAVC